VKVPFLSLEIRDQAIRSQIESAIDRVVHSNRFILGPEVSLFEEEWAAYVDASFCVTVGNGLDALQLALLAAGIGPGDEVLVPAHTFIATWFAVSNVGALPVPIPMEAGTPHLDPLRIEEAVTIKTKAIIPVHLYGHPARLREILATARKHGLVVVEDAAQAHGARYLDKRIGSHGDIVAWSFYPGKNLGALGDAGAITSNNPDFIERVRRLRNYGSEKKYAHEIVGFNSRMDELQAAVLRVKLGCLDSWNRKRRAIARYYAGAIGEALAGYRHHIALPQTREDSEPVWHLYVIQTAFRDELVSLLENRGIETLIHYPLDPLNQEAYGHLRLERRADLSRNHGDWALSLPIGPHLDRIQTEQVASAVVETATALFSRPAGSGRNELPPWL
jgi:dTDP-4-amino-4,6-dideoxygalactose transaminase